MRKGFFITENEDDFEANIKHRRLITILLTSLVTLLGVFSLVMMIIQLKNVDGTLNFNLIFYPIQGYFI